MTRYKKHLGQHILRDPEILARIVERAGVVPGSRVLEIGPGPGNLTRLLAQAVGPGGEVRCVELDQDWRASLGAVAGEFPWVRVHWGDILRADIPDLLGGSSSSAAEPWMVVANIPYYITTAIVERLLEHRDLFGRIALLVQREVAARIACRSGRESGAVSHFVQYHCEPTLAFEVPARAFVPPPEVESALLLLDVRSRPAVDVPEKDLALITRLAFGERRKMLRKSLRGLPGLQTPDGVDRLLERAGVPGMSRPEELALEQFAALARAWAEVASKKEG